MTHPVLEQGRFGHCCKIRLKGDREESGDQLKSHCGSNLAGDDAGGLVHNGSSRG